MGKLFSANVQVDSTSAGRRMVASDLPQGEGFKAVGKAGLAQADRLIAAKARIDLRTDTLERIQAEQDYKTGMADLRTSLENEDMSRPDTITKFTTGAKDLANKAFEAYQGGADQRAKLIENITNENGILSREFNALHLTAANERTDGIITSQFSTVAQQARATGDIMTALEQVQEVQDNVAGVRSGPQQRADAIAGKSLVYNQVFDGFIERGDIASARDVMETEGLIDVLGTKGMTRMRSAVIKAETDLESGQIEAQKALEFAAASLGVKVEDLTDADRRDVANLSKKEVTQEEKLATAQRVYKKATGHDMSEAQIDKFMGVLVDERTRTFTKAGSRELAANLGPLILSGEATEQDQVDFVAATTELTTETTFIDKDGMIQRRRGEITQTSKDALEKLGVDPRGAPLSAEGEVATSPVGDDETAIGVEALPPENTVFGLLSKGTGFASWVRAGIAHTPFIGEVLPASDVIAARTQLERMSQELVDLYRLSDRGITEIKELKDELSVAPAALETQTGAKAVVVGIDRNLDKRIKDTQRILDAGNISKKDWDRLRTFRNKAETFRKNLGLPQRYKTFKEAQKAVQEGRLKPGEEFLGSDDKFYQAPRGE